MMEESSAPQSPVGFYRERLDPGINLPTLGAVTTYQSVADIEVPSGSDTLSPQVPGENESFDNQVTNDSTTDNETGTDETLGNYTRTVTWATQLTRNGDQSSYTEHRLKTYTVVTQYTDSNGVESTLTQTGTTVDNFQLETYIDPMSGESSPRTATWHTETDNYDFAQTWTTTETDPETGDVVVTTLAFAASGSQAFSNAAADTGDPDIAPIAKSAGQSETASLGIALTTTSASGLSTATTTFGVDGNFSWALQASRWQQSGATTVNSDWMSGPIDPQLETAEAYTYHVSGGSNSSLTHIASGAETVNRTSTVTPDTGGDPVEVDLTIDSDVDFNYALNTHDEFEFDLDGDDPVVGGQTVDYTYDDDGWLEESLTDDSTVAVTSQSTAGIVTLNTDSDVDQHTRWDYDTTSFGSLASAVYAFDMHGATTGDSDTSTNLGMTVHEDNKTTSTGVSSHATSHIVNDQFDYNADATSTPHSASAGTTFTADQETNWTSSEGSSYSVVDDTDPEQHLTFLATSTTDYTNGVDTLVVNNTIAMGAETNAEGEGTLTVTSEYSSLYDSTADWTGLSQTLFELDEDARNLSLIEASTTLDEDGTLVSQDHETGDSNLTVTTEHADADTDGVIGNDEFSATVAYDQTDDFLISNTSGSTQTNTETTDLKINHDTSDPGRDVYLHSFSIYQETVTAGSGSSLSGGGTLTVADIQTTTDGWTPPDPVDANGVGVPDDPPPSTTAQVSYIGTSNAATVDDSTGHYTLHTTVDYDDADNRDPSNTATTHSHSTYAEGDPTQADPDGGDVSFHSESGQSITYNNDGSIVAAVFSDDTESQAADYVTEETLTVDSLYKGAPEPLDSPPKEGRGAVAAQPLEVSYAPLFSSARPSGTQILRNDVTDTLMTADVRATHTDTNYNDAGHLQSSSHSHSGTQTTASPNPTPDPEDEDSAWLYSTAGDATATSEYHDHKTDFDYHSITNGTDAQLGGEEGSEVTSVDYPLDGSPSPTSPGADTPTPQTPPGVGIPALTGVFFLGISNFRDEYHEHGHESLDTTASSEYSIVDDNDFSNSDSSTIYSRNADIDGRTDRQGAGVSGGSSIVEESIGSSSVSVTALTHSNLGHSSEYATGVGGGSTMPGGGHVFAPGELPDAYAMDDTVVDSTSTMTSIGFTQAAGAAGADSYSSHADYVSDSNETFHTRDFGSTWDYNDAGGEPGSPHSYTLTTNNQSGSHYIRYIGTADGSGNSGGHHVQRTVVYGFTTGYVHNDTATVNDGRTGRTVHDHRSTDFSHTSDEQESGGPLHTYKTDNKTESGNGTVDITTEWSGGWLAGASGTDGRVVSDPDTITQHFDKQNESHVTYTSDETNDNGGPFGRDISNDLTNTYEYNLAYAKPQPPEGWPEGEEWYPEDDGVTFSVLAYEQTSDYHDHSTDGSPEGVANWTSSLESDFDRQVLDTLTANNQFSETVTYSGSTVPFPWTGDPGGSYSNTTTGSGELPSPGQPTNGFAQTYPGYRDAGAPLATWYIPVEDNSDAASPDLLDTFSSSLASPVAAETQHQEPKLYQFVDQTNSPVKDEAPAAPETPELPKKAGEGDGDGDGDGCGCGCGDIKKDQTGDEVGVISTDAKGEKIVTRNGKERLLSDVEDYDEENDEATSADWDAFFELSGWTVAIDRNGDGKPDVIMSNEAINLADRFARRQFGKGEVTFAVGGLAADDISDYLQMIELGKSLQNKMQALSQPGWAETFLSSDAAESRISALGNLQLKWNQLASEYSNKYGDNPVIGRTGLNDELIFDAVVGNDLGSAVRAFAKAGTSNDYGAQSETEGIVFDVIGVAQVAKLASLGLKVVGGSIVRKTAAGASKSLGDVAAAAGNGLKYTAQAACQTGTGLVPRGAVQLGKWGETRLADYLKWAGVKPKGAFYTSRGTRFFDRLVDGVAHESKAGVNVRLTYSYKQQILKDAELIQSGTIKGAHWHFWQGADPSILDFLTANGIKYTVH